METDELDKQYYKIKEVSDLLGLPCSTLRYWEAQFDFISPRRSEKHTRFYTASDIEKLKLVKFLVHDRGMRIDVAREAIKHNHSGLARRFRALERLQDVRSRLAAILAAIDNTNRI